MGLYKWDYGEYKNYARTNGADIKDLSKLNWCLKNVLNYFVFHHMK